MIVYFLLCLCFKWSFGFNIRPVTPTPSCLFLSADSRLEELGLEIPQVPPSSKGNYKSCIKSGNMLYLCGHIPQRLDGTLITGKLGETLSTEDGYESARQCALNILGTLQQELGTLNRVKQIVKVVGFVNSSDDFIEQHLVMNGVSDIFGQVFETPHARSAVGCNTLPLNIATEVECIVELLDENTNGDN